MTRHTGFLFADLFAGLLLVFLVPLMIAYFDEPKAEAKSPIPKAEMIVEMTWPDGSDTDMDLYAKAPTGEIVFFRNKRVPSMFLDVDNLGTGNTMLMPDGTYQTIPSRVEIITVRGVVAGEYTINVHAYRKLPGSTPEMVHVRVTKLNPYSVVVDAMTQIDEQGQEVTMANFTMDAQGNVTGVYQSQTKLVGGGT